MNRPESKLIKTTVSNLLSLNKDQFGFDGFFRSEQVDHDISLNSIDAIMSEEPNWSTLQVYEHLLLPIIIANPTKHQAISTIYRTLALACQKDLVRRNYFEMWFKHMMLSKLNGVKDVNGVSRFYAMLLTRDSCCSLCKPFGDDQIFGFDELFTVLPSIVRGCQHQNSCHSAIAVISSNAYEEKKRRGGYE